MTTEGKFNKQESKKNQEEIPENFYEDRLEKMEEFKDKELEIFQEAQESIKKEQDTEKKQKRASKLTAFALTTLIALGIGGETIKTQAFEQQKPSKQITIELKQIETRELKEKRIKNYQELKKIIETTKIEEKVKFLKEEYGETIESFLELNYIEQTLEHFKKLESAIGKGDKDVFVKKDSPYAMTLGSIVSDCFNNYWKEKSKTGKLEQAKGLEITGFEKVKEFSNERLLEELKKIYPNQWLSGSVKKIEFIPKIFYQHRSDQDYGINKGYVHGETETFGLTSLLEKDPRSSIKIYERPYGVKLTHIIDTLNHELAHDNDWENSRILSSGERIELFYDVTQRYKSGDRFDSEYVESINNEDEHLKNYLMAKEYWAEIIRYYMLDKKWFKEKYPKDSQLIEKWFNTINDIEN